MLNLDDDLEFHPRDPFFTSARVRAHILEARNEMDDLFHEKTIAHRE